MGPRGVARENCKNDEVPSRFELKKRNQFIEGLHVNLRNVCKPIEVWYGLLARTDCIP